MPLPHVRKRQSAEQWGPPLGPSSHSSPGGSVWPLPQCSSRQLSEQPLSLSGGSHCSCPSVLGLKNGFTTRSPQLGIVQLALHVALAPLVSQYSTGFPSAPLLVLTRPSPHTFLLQPAVQSRSSALFAPSSHSSPAFLLTLPSPQLGTVQSRLQVADSPPPSHCSPLLTMPSPHSSDLHFAEQPSPSVMLPSSHCSSESMTPLPQLSVMHTGWLAAHWVPAGHTMPVAAHGTAPDLVAQPVTASAAHRAANPNTHSERITPPRNVLAPGRRRLRARPRARSRCPGRGAPRGGSDRPRGG